jgi:hypothetical protein
MSWRILSRVLFERDLDQPLDDLDQSTDDLAASFHPDSMIDCNCS